MSVKSAVQENLPQFRKINSRFKTVLLHLIFIPIHGTKNLCLAICQYSIKFKKFSLS